MDLYIFSLSRSCASVCPSENFSLLFFSKAGKFFRLTYFLPAYLPHLLHLKAVEVHPSISSTLLSGVQLDWFQPWRLLIKFYIFLSPFRMVLTKPCQAFGRPYYYPLFQGFRRCLASRSLSKASFGWPTSLLCSLDSGAPAWIFKGKQITL